MIQQQGIFFCITDHIGGRSDNREAIMLDHFGEAGTAKLLKILKAKTMRVAAVTGTKNAEKVPDGL